MVRWLYRAEWVVVGQVLLLLNIHLHLPHYHLLHLLLLYLHPHWCDAP